MRTLSVLSLHQKCTWLVAKKKTGITYYFFPPPPSPLPLLFFFSGLSHKMPWKNKMLLTVCKYLHLFTCSSRDNFFSLKNVWNMQIRWLMTSTLNPILYQVYKLYMYCGQFTLQPIETFGALVSSKLHCMHANFSPYFVVKSQLVSHWIS